MVYNTNSENNFLQLVKTIRREKWHKFDLYKIKIIIRNNWIYNFVNWCFLKKGGKLRNKKQKNKSFPNKVMSICLNFFFLSLPILIKGALATSCCLVINAVIATFCLLSADQLIPHKNGTSHMHTTFCDFYTHNFLHLIFKLTPYLFR